jgi:CRISPR-associated protein Cas5t
MEYLCLYVSVPVAGFRVPRAREYFETFPCPPPSTVFGMLLSLAGEERRDVHEGAEIAIALLDEPAYSVVLRTMWRIKKRNVAPGLGENRRPDYQELLTGIRLAVWERAGRSERAEQPLVARIADAMTAPQSVTRYGGLSLGESTHLIDEVRIHRPAGADVGLLVADDEGDLALPIWADHVGSRTRWGQYTVREWNDSTDLPEEAWTPILRPGSIRTTP